MSVKDGLSRKEFLASFGKGLLGAALGGAAGQARAAEAAPADPLPYRLEQVAMLDPQMEKVYGIACDGKDRLYVAGSAGVKVYDAQQALLRTLKTSDTAVAVAVDPEGYVYAAQRTKIEKFDPEGALIKSFGERGDGPGQLRYVTGVAASAKYVYVTDSGARRILRFASDREYVDYVDAIAGPDEENGKKFVIPSAYFDCKVDAQGTLFVGHTGMHRVERYDANNFLLGAWGRFGGDREGFCGCCNPTNLALFPDGRVATTEKGVPRLKVHDTEGKLLACLDEGAFPGNTAGMALAVSSKGRIALVEPIEKQIRFFELK